MGNLCSSGSDSAAQRANDKIEAEMNNARDEEGQTHKLLLLGAGESGKSTLFKQMINIYGKGFTQKDRKAYVSVIYRNTLQSIEELVKQCQNAKNKKDWGPECVNTDENVAKSMTFISELKYEDGTLPQEAVKHIKIVWASPAIQACYLKRSEFQLFDSAKYFLDKIEETASNDLPTDEDILRARVRTTGIVENEFEIDTNKFKMYDVGGQRNERKKWIHCFEDVTAVIFVAGISAYDQVLYEDEAVNRTEESLNLFENICNSRWFRDTPIILFLNKCDLFREKIFKTPLSVTFPDYDDWAKQQESGDAYTLGTAFLEQQFLNRNHFKKPIYSHVTCATDQRNVEVVFNGVKDIVCRGALITAGLI
jgi:GTPase SAR1 family protein